MNQIGWVRNAINLQGQDIDIRCGIQYYPIVNLNDNSIKLHCRFDNEYYLDHILSTVLFPRFKVFSRLLIIEIQGTDKINFDPQLLTIKNAYAPYNQYTYELRAFGMPDDTNFKVYNSSRINNSSIFQNRLFIFQAISK